jgi:hypothetical protein
VTFSTSTIRHTIAIAAAALVVFVIATPAGALTSTRTITIYALSTQGRYANHKDDRARGALHNPFNADEKAVKGSGTRVGDNALIGFKLYSDPSLKKQIGSGTYSCTFNSAHVALCEADFQLDHGAMFASGPANFSSSTFTLAVSGGTGQYLSARGQVSSAPAANGAHRLTFVIR